LPSFPPDKPSHVCGHKLSDRFPRVWIVHRPAAWAPPARKREFCAQECTKMHKMFPVHTRPELPQPYDTHRWDTVHRISFADEACCSADGAKPVNAPSRTFCPCPSIVSRPNRLHSPVRHVLIRLRYMLRCQSGGSAPNEKGEFDAQECPVRLRRKPRRSVASATRSRRHRHPRNLAPPPTANPAEQTRRVTPAPPTPRKYPELSTTMQILQNKPAAPPPHRHQWPC
jgi:hypothetical protein